MTNYEITIHDKKIDNIKKTIKQSSINYYEDPFLDNVIFATLTNDIANQLQQNPKITIEKAHNAHQTNNA